MTWIVLAVLREVRPMWFYILAATLFVLSQLDYFLLNKVCDNSQVVRPSSLRPSQVICKGASAKVDGSFVATVLETAAVIVLYLAWRSITEGEWFFGLDSSIWLVTNKSVDSQNPGMIMCTSQTERKGWLDGGLRNYGLMDHRRPDVQSHYYLLNFPHLSLLAILSLP